MTPNNFLYGDNANSTTTPLAAGATWTGEARDMAMGGYAGILISLLTSASGTLYAEQSIDGVHWDSSLAFDIDANTDESHRINVTRKYYRTRFVNGSTPQTFLRLQTMYNQPTLLSSPFNSTLQQDADAIATRSIPPQLEIATGRLQGVSVTNKVGVTSMLAVGTQASDVMPVAGAYTGFPVTAAEEFQLLSSSASDTGTVTFQYLASATSTEYTTVSVALNGTTPVNTGITGIRAHTMRYDTGDDTTFNLGTITLRWRTTTAVVFLTISPGKSQSNYAVFTIPYRSVGYVQNITGSILGNQSTAAIEGALWARASGESPRLRRPFSIAFSSSLNDQPYGGIPMAQGTDIVLRIINVLANNTEVIAGFDIVLVRDP